MLKVDKNRGCIRLSFPMIHHGIEKIFHVTMRPDAQIRGFVTETTTFNNNRPVPIDLSRQLSVEAERIFFATLAKQLSNEKVIADIATRITISYYVTSVSYLKERKLLHTHPIDLPCLMAAMRHIVYAVKAAKMDESESKHELASDYFVTIRDNALTRVRGIYWYDDRQIAFYRSVLSRAFAWRNGKIPMADYRLAFSIM